MVVPAPVASIEPPLMEVVIRLPMSAINSPSFSMPHAIPSINPRIIFLPISIIVVAGEWIPKKSHIVSRIDLPSDKTTSATLDTPFRIPLTNPLIIPSGTLENNLSKLKKYPKTFVLKSLKALTILSNESPSISLTRSIKSVICLSPFPKYLRILSYTFLKPSASLSSPF